MEEMSSVSLSFVEKNDVLMSRQELGTATLGEIDECRQGG